MCARSSKIDLLVAVFSLALCIAIPCSAEEKLGPVSSESSDGSDIRPAIDPVVFQRLIKHLGDDSYLVRQDAHRRLIEMGPAAHAYLIAVRQHRNPEIRLRVERILDAHRVQKLRRDRLEFESKLSAYEVDTTGKLQVDLPGLRRFSSEVGTDLTSRKLFIEILKAEPDLLLLAESDPKRASDLFRARVSELYQQMRRGRNRQVDIGTISAILFLASDKRIVSGASDAQLYYFFYQTTFRTRIRDASRNAPLKKLLGSWVATEGDTNVDYQKITLSMQYNIPQGLVAGRRIAENHRRGKVVANNYYLAYGLLAIAKFGSEKDYPLLSALLEDKRALYTRKRNAQIFESQTRDIALAALLHMTKQDLKKYGFARAQRNSTYLYSFNSLGFDKANEKARDAGQAKWKKFATKLKIKELPPIKPDEKETEKDPDKDEKKVAGGDKKKEEKKKKNVANDK